MNLDLLLSFVQAPQKMADHPVSDLEGMVAEHPYFSAAQMLLLKQYKLQNSSKFNKQLRHAAGVLPDRKQLYRLIEIWPEEVNEVLAADAAVEVVAVPVVQPVSSPEVKPVVLPEEPIELAAPLSEVPLEQLEEVQSLGKETVLEDVSLTEEVEMQAEDQLLEALESDLEAASAVTGRDDLAEQVSPADPATDAAAVPNPSTATASEKEEVIEEVEHLETDATLIEAEALEAEAETKQEAPAKALSATLAPDAIENTSRDAAMPVEEWPVVPAPADASAEVEVSGKELEQSEPTIAQAPAETAESLPDAPAVVETIAPPASTLVAGTSEQQHEANVASAPITPTEVAEFIAKPHDRLSWFKFFAGKPLREQSDEVLDQLYQEHMQQDLLRAPEQDQQISAIRAQINRDEEVPSSKALEEEIRRLAYESISDDELPASETLAGIYAAQHDYKKAIRIYQKLILKFPDKMSYFARLIEELRAKS